MAARPPVQTRPEDGSRHGWPSIAARLMLAIVGGYLVSAALVAALSAGLSAIGMARSEGTVLASMFGFVVYLALLLWAFAVRKLRVLCAGLALLAVGGFALASLAGPGA